MHGQDKILSLWAFTAVDEDGTEGVVAVTIPGFGPFPQPLVGADLARVGSLKPYAQRVADETGRPVTLSHFSVRTDEQTFHPSVFTRRAK